VEVAIALGALLVAIGGYLLNRRAIAAEARDRKRSLELLEKQVATDVAAHEASGQAVVRAEPGSISWGDPTSAYQVTLVNGGPASARDVQYRVIDQDDFTIAEGDVASILLRGERQRIAVSIPRAEYGRLVVLVKWLDRNGHEEPVCDLLTQP
jgi:hypothetical protein